MAFTARTRLVNPRLGTYFGIFAAAFASLVLMALMFEQLGTADAAVRLLMFAGPIVLFVAIGLLVVAFRSRALAPLGLMAGLFGALVVYWMCLAFGTSRRKPDAGAAGNGSGTKG